MADEPPQVFLSHSHKDKEFVRLLDASLISAGVKTFLDEKEILVGDSIPERIYDGIGLSTHLIYVISKSSVESKWVREELSIAKIREKESTGFRILPLLMDEVELPTGIIHARYADFRDWRNPDSYRVAFLEILRAMNIEPRLFNRTDLVWYAQNASKVRNIQRTLRTVIGLLAGGRYDAIAATTKSYYSISIKYALRESYTFSSLKQLYSELLKDIDNDVKGRLSAIKKAAQQAYEFGYPLRPDEIDKAHEFERQVEVIVNMLEEIRSEAEITMLASFSMSEKLDMDSTR